MINRKFIIAATVAIAAPALLLLPWALAAMEPSLLVYVMCLSLLGVIVGGFVSSKIRSGCIGGTLACILAGIFGLAASAYWLRSFSFDIPEVALMAWLGCGAFSGIVGLIFGLGIGQPTRGNR